MAVYFHCSGCGAEHRSRVRAPDAAWLSVYMAACGPLIEPCALTGEWVTVSPEDASWVDELPEPALAAGSTWLPGLPMEPLPPHLLPSL